MNDDATKNSKTILDEEDYNESEDEDFNPENANKEAKRGENGDVKEDTDDDDSEDDREDYQDEEEKDLDKKYKDLEGVGLIKTRAQRREEELKEKEYAKSQEKSSIDVNALWNELNGPKESGSATASDQDKGSSSSTSTDAKATTSSSIQEEYITIQRTYRFAGQTTSEEKRVLASSAEGKAYLAEERAKLETVSKPKPRGPKKRKSTLLDELEAGKAKKMNTLEKSRLDWLGFVDQEGIRDDLKTHNKGGYLQKQDFLSRVENKIDQDIKNALKKK